MKKETLLIFYRNYKPHVFSAIVAFSSLILIIFVIYPQTAKLITGQKAEREIANKSKFLESKVQALEGYDSEDLNQKVNFALGAYPTEKDFVFEIGLLQNLVSQSGFSITSMTLGSSSQAGTNFQSYSIKLEVIGPQTLLQVLLNNIERSSRLMKVGSIETAIGRDIQQTGISLIIDVYYSSAPTAFGSIDSPLPSLSEKDQEVIAKLAKAGAGAAPANLLLTAPLGPRGKLNPFE